MIIVFKNGKTLKVDKSVVISIRQQMPINGAEYFFWVNDKDGNPTYCINVFDISFIK